MHVLTLKLPIFRIDLNLKMNKLSLIFLLFWIFGGCKAESLESIALDGAREITLKAVEKSPEQQVLPYTSASEYGFSDAFIFSPTSLYNSDYFGGNLVASRSCVDCDKFLLVSNKTRDYYASNWTKYLHFFKYESGSYVNNKTIQGNFRDYSVDGNNAAVGYPWNAPNAESEEGEISVFRWSGSFWVQESLEVPTEHQQVGAHLGWSVSLFGDTLVASAPDWDVLNDGFGNRYNDVGRLYVWQRNAMGQWLFKSSLANPILPVSQQAGKKLGSRVRLDGSSIVSSNGTTRLDVWDYYNNSWMHSSNPISFSGTLSDVRLKNDLIAIGKSSDNRVQLFLRSGGAGSAYSSATTLQPFDNDAQKAFGYSIWLEGDRIVVGAPADSRGDIIQGGAVYVYPESVYNHSWPSGTGISAKFFNTQL